MKILLAFFANTCANFVIGLLIAKFLGPEEYGRFALAFAVHVVAQTALYDWLKFSTTRFYSERTRDMSPQIRASLAVSFLCITILVFLICGIYLYIGPIFNFETTLILLAMLLAVANGLFDYSTALARARFDDHTYGRLVLVKNILALFFIGGGAFIFHSAAVALAGTVVSLFTTFLYGRAFLYDPGVSLRQASRTTVKDLISYSTPMVLALLLYHALPLATRALAADFYDFAESGQLALAYDVGMRAMMAFGTALDVLLFQIAVAKHELQGEDQAKRQVAYNMSVVFIILLPACVGLGIVLPSVEALMVPLQFHGAFRHYLGILLPGLFAMGLVNFGINPIYQIEKRTAPVVFAAVAAAATAFILLLTLPKATDASHLALAQAGGYVAALVSTFFFALRSQAIWPSLRDILYAVLGSGTMYIILLQSADMPPGLSTLVRQILIGGLIYLIFVLVFNIARLRNLAIDWIRPYIAWT